MRKVTKSAIDAFMNNEPFMQGNTQVYCDHGSGEIELLLHGSVIARLDSSKEFSITNAGHFTNVTKERLNGFPFINIEQVKGQWYLNGEPWDGEWINIPEAKSLFT